MLVGGAGGLTEEQCRSLVRLVTGHPSSEVGSTADEWAALLDLPVYDVRNGLRALTAPRRRYFGKRYQLSAGQSAGADPDASSGA
jgi:hypothetical protein